MNLDELRHRVAEEYAISDMVHRLRGTNEEELRADAEYMITLLGLADRMADIDTRRPAEIIADMFRNDDRFNKEVEVS